jgi:rod shape-determining protein MreD
MIISIKRLELLLWLVTPAVITFLMFILCAIPKYVWGINYIMPVLPLIPVFYWGREQTPEITYWFVFIIGLLTDVVSGLPLGMSALLYILFLLILHKQAKYMHKEGFAIVWGYFILLLAIISMIEWVLMSFSANQTHAIPAAILQLLITASCYPLFHKMFDIISDHIKQRRWILSHV